VLDHLNRALHETMAADERVIFLGEDVLDPPATPNAKRPTPAGPRPT